MCDYYYCMAGEKKRQNLPRQTAFNIRMFLVRTAVEHTQMIIAFTFIHLADAFIQSDLHLRNTISDTL